MQNMTLLYLMYDHTMRLDRGEFPRENPAEMSFLSVNHSETKTSHVHIISTHVDISVQ